MPSGLGFQVIRYCCDLAFLHRLRQSWAFDRMSVATSEKERPVFRDNRVIFSTTSSLNSSSMRLGKSLGSRRKEVVVLSEVITGAKVHKRSTLLRSDRSDSRFALRIPTLWESCRLACLCLERKSAFGIQGAEVGEMHLSHGYEEQTPKFDRGMSSVLEQVIRSI